MAKKYRLLKDLPFAKAGDIFKGELEYGTTVLFPEDYENYKHKLSSDEFWDFDEWFEEIKEPEQIYYVDNLGGYVSKIDENQFAIFPALIANLKSTGNYFETREEAEKYLEFLKARTIIKQDTKGFKPNWQDTDEDKWCGVWDIIHKEVSTHITWYGQEDSIYFKSKEDVKESFEKHPNEWRTYLTYEQ